MSLVEYEFANEIAPLRNGTGISCMISLTVDSGQHAIDLAGAFGKIEAPHFWTLKSDGGKSYVALAANGLSGISPTAVGTGAGICWPIADGQEIAVRLTGGQERSGSGWATGVNNYQWLHYTGQSGTTLRLRRSSLEPGQGAGEFSPPTL